MGLRDLLTGRSSCAAPGSSSSSPNPLSAFVDSFIDRPFIGYSPKSEELSATAVIRKDFNATPLSTVPGDENEFKIDQGSIRTMKGTDFVNGHHGEACGEIFQTSIQLKQELSATAILRKAFNANFLSTILGDENEFKLDQGSIRTMKGTDFVNGHHGDACGGNFHTSILSVPELRGIEPHFHESEQIDSATTRNVMPKPAGPPEMDAPYPLRRSPFQQYNVLVSKEYLHGPVNRSMDYIDHSYDNEMRRPRTIPHPQMTQLAKGQIGGTDITDMVVLAQSHTLEHTSAGEDHPKFQGLVMSDNGEVSGGWLSFLGIALTHLGGLSQPRFWDEPIKWHDQVIGHRVWIELKGLQQRSGWSVTLEATRNSLFDALQDAAMLAVITMRLHFPLEFRGTPFTVLPMVPGQRSELDYLAIDGGAEATTFMGINYDDVWTLLRERFTSFHRESSQTLKEYFAENQQSFALAKKTLEALPPTPANNQRIENLLHMGNMEGTFIPRDCSWTVLVSNKAQQPQVEPSHQEEKPPATASSLAVRARL
uniref:Uncharacterized protein n=1 Tax=Avena sativa TaxID=4498 RepID=A0ACD5YF16_AVESA